jgi:hypothetical protein
MMFQCHIICINDIIYTWFFVWNIYTIIVINWSLKKHVLHISWQVVEKEFSLYTLWRIFWDEYFRCAEYATMLVNFRLPEGLGQTLLCFVTVFFNKLFMIYRRKCNWATTCKCTVIALDLPVGLSIIGAAWSTKSSIMCLVNLNRCTSYISVM